MDDEGGSAPAWLLKVALSLGVVGLLGHDGVSVLLAELDASDSASTAASAAADDYRSDSDPQRSFEAALRTLTSPADTIDPRSFAVHPDGTVSLTLHRTAGTLWLRHLSPLAHLARIAATGRSGSPS